MIVLKHLKSHRHINHYNVSLPPYLKEKKKTLCFFAQMKKKTTYFILKNYCTRWKLGCLQQRGEKISWNCSDKLSSLVHRLHVSTCSVRLAAWWHLFMVKLLSISVNFMLIVYSLTLTCGHLFRYISPSCQLRPSEM